MKKITAFFALLLASFSLLAGTLAPTPYMQHLMNTVANQSQLGTAAGVYTITSVNVPGNTNGVAVASTGANSLQITYTWDTNNVAGVGVGAITGSGAVTVTPTVVGTITNYVLTIAPNSFDTYGLAQTLATAAQSAAQSYAAGLISGLLGSNNAWAGSQTFSGTVVINDGTGLTGLLGNTQMQGWLLDNNGGLLAITNIQAWVTNYLASIGITQGIGTNTNNWVVAGNLIVQGNTTLAGNLTMPNVAGATNFLGPTVLTNPIVVGAITYVTNPILSVQASGSASGLSNTTVYVTLNVTNTGGGTVSGAATISASGWSVYSGTPFSLTNNQVDVVTLAYFSATPTTNTASVVFTGGAGATSAVTANVTNGVTQAPAQLASGPAPTNSYAVVNTTQTQVINVTNSAATGAANLSGTITVTGTGFSGNATISAITPGAYASYTISYLTATAATNTGTIVVACAGALTGTNTYTWTAGETNATSPLLAVTPTTLTLECPTNTTTNWSFAATNTGAGTASGTVAVLTGGTVLSVSPTSYSFTAGQGGLFTVTFTPGATAVTNTGSIEWEGSAASGATNNVNYIATNVPTGGSGVLLSRANMLAAYQFNESAGTNRADTLGLAGSLVDSGTTVGKVPEGSISTGAIGSALASSTSTGTENQMTNILSTTNSAVWGDIYTISLWFCPSNVTQAGGYLFGQTNHVQIKLATTNIICSVMTAAGFATNLTLPYTIAANTWYNVVLSAAITNGVSGANAGGMVWASVTPANGATVFTNTSVAPWFNGHGNFSAPAEDIQVPCGQQGSYAGLIDELYIWNIPLSTNAMQQLSTNFVAGSGGTTSVVTSYGTF